MESLLATSSDRYWRVRWQDRILPTYLPKAETDLKLPGRMQDAHPGACSGPGLAQGVDTPLGLTGE